MRLCKPLSGFETKGLLSAGQELKQLVLQGVRDGIKGSGCQGSGFRFFDFSIPRTRKVVDRSSLLHFPCLSVCSVGSSLRSFVQSL